MHKRFIRIVSWLIAPAMMITWFVVPTSASAVSACSSVVIDNNASEWTPITSLVSDGADVTENWWYYNSTTDTWVNEVTEVTGAAALAAGYDWRLDVDRMMDIEDVKVCNDAQWFYVYYKSFFPLVGIEPLDVVTGDGGGSYFELGDVDSTNGPGDTIGSPVDFDKWLVFSINNLTAQDDLYFYTIHLTMDEFDSSIPGMEPGIDNPVEIKFWEDTDNSGTFHYNVDTELIDFTTAQLSSNANNSGSKLYTEGALEVDMALVASGDDVFNVTGWNYYDYLEVSLSTFDDSYFGTVLASTDVNKAIDSTEVGRYKLKKLKGNQPRVIKKFRKAHKLTIKTKKIKGASKYRWQIKGSDGKLVQQKTIRKRRATFRGLDPETTYTVRVRVRVDDQWLPYTKYRGVKTKALSS